MTSLDRIEIKGFKSIRELDLELRPLNILIGANGAGKSNFIGVFELLNQIVNKNLQNYVARSGGADSLLYFGRKMTDEISLKLHFGQYGYEARLTATIDDSFYFSREECFHTDKQDMNSLTVAIHSANLESNLERGSRSAEFAHAINGVTNALKSWKIYQFHDTSDSAKVKATSKIGDNAFLRPDASNLAAFLYRLKETHFAHYDRIVKTIRRVAPFFDDFQLRPNPLNEETIRLEWREKGSDQYFSPSRFSDGTLRFISLVTLLLQPDEMLPSTILIDEPELGLHPYAINTLAGILGSISTQTQVIVATQSVPLVNQFTPDDVIVVDRYDKESSYRHLQQAEIESWLDDYSLGDIWEKNIIGGTP